MNNIHAVRVEDGQGIITTYNIVDSGRPPWCLKFECDAIGKKEYAGTDLFECLVALRKELEQRNLKLICNGARVDVWPSNMLRSMGGAKKVYITQLGKPAFFEQSLVHLLGDTTIESVGTLAEQYDYHQKWIESTK